ncbi:MAG: DUF3108 domain-containing protein [Candidatus Omnitrophota bacterium]
MNRIRLGILFFIFLVLLFIIIKFGTPIKNSSPAKPKPISITLQKKTASNINFSKEKIIYDVKIGKINLGIAEFTYLGQSLNKGRLLNEMLMKTRLKKFTDTDRIFSDPITLLPVIVEREISKLFSREKITEEYDQKNFTVTINKTVGLETETTVIQKDGPIHNVILLPHYVRKNKDLNIGKTITVNLPTRKLELKLTSIENIKTPAGLIQAYHFESTPKQIEIWVSADSRKIPLKIESSGLLGYTMLMKKYIADFTN